MQDDLPIFRDYVSDFVQALRHRAGFTKETLAAEHLQILRTNISRYENSIRQPPPGYLAALACLIVAREPDPARIPAMQEHLLREINRVLHLRGKTISDWAHLCALADAYPPKVRQRSSPLSLDLPLEHIPTPGLITARHNLLYAPNPFFCGRDAELQHLAALCAAGPTRIAITGIGGMGKSQLAAEFAQRYGRFFPGGVFHLSFAQPDRIEEAALACVIPGAYGIPADSFYLPVAERLLLLRQSWQHAPPLLLIFDNCEDPALFAAWCPPHGNARVLLTSRRRAWDAACGITTLPLNQLQRADSIALLQKYVPERPAQPADLEALAAYCGDLPLALHLIGKYLHRYRYGRPVQNLLSELAHAGHTPVWPVIFNGHGPSPTDHREQLDQTLAWSFTQLDPADPVDHMALHLMAAAARELAPGVPILRSTLLGAYTADAPSEQSQRLADALARLVDDCGLLEPLAEDAFRLHPLVAVVAQTYADGSLFTMADAVLRELDAFTSNSLVAPKILVQHARFIADRSAGRHPSLYALLCRALGWQLILLAQHGDAMPYARTAVDACTSAFGAEHYETAHALNDYGLVLQVFSQPHAARTAFTQAFQIFQAHGAGYAAERAMTANNLGQLLVLLGDFTESQTYLRMAYAERCRLFGKQSAPATKVLVSRGLLLLHRGKARSAAQVFRIAIQNFAQQQIVNQRSVVYCRTLLCEALFNGGEYRALASELDRSEAAIYELYAETYSEFKGIVRWLRGLIAQQSGDDLTARSYFVDAMHISKQIAVPNFADALRYQVSLASVLVKIGDTTQARPLLDQALAVWRERRGPYYFYSAQALCVLADLERQEGRHDVARSCLEQACRIYQLAFGARHPATQAIQQQLSAA